jgi:hypothetical protein
MVAMDSAASSRNQNTKLLLPQRCAKVAKRTKKGSAFHFALLAPFCG